MVAGGCAGGSPRSWTLLTRRRLAQGVSGLTCRFNVALAALAARAVSIGALPGHDWPLPLSTGGVHGRSGHGQSGDSDGDCHRPHRRRQGRRNLGRTGHAGPVATTRRDPASGAGRRVTLVLSAGKTARSTRAGKALLLATTGHWHCGFPHQTRRAALRHTAHQERVTLPVDAGSVLN